MELLRAASNTLELERVLEGGLTASDTQINFLTMPRGDQDHTYVDISRHWMRSSVGLKVMEDMRRGLPLFTFFSLFGQTLASLPEVLACARHFPTSATLTAYRRPAPSPFVDLAFFRRNSEGVQHEFRLTVPVPVYQQVQQHEFHLKRTEGRSLCGLTNPNWKKKRALPDAASMDEEGTPPPTAPHAC